MRFFVLFILVVYFGDILSLREFRSWSNRTSCQQSKSTNYPFAYSKYNGQAVESKGRVSSNLQDFRHECQVKGGNSKCHICEKIVCDNNSATCFLQLQGVQTREMSINIAVVSDTAWAVGGSHRHDYGNPKTTHFCVFISGGSCILPSSTDFSSCKVRCFGYGFSKPARAFPVASRSVVDVHNGMLEWPDDGQVDYWAYPRNCSDLKAFQNKSCSYPPLSKRTPDFNPQGFSFTLAGSGVAGFSDGKAGVAMFSGPRDVAVDNLDNIYVADTLNNAIRMIDSSGFVTTLAGKGPLIRGYRDGNCSDATFTEPQGIDVRTETDQTTGFHKTILVVADTGNHRIRRLEYIAHTKHCTVSCLSGLCGNNSLTEYLFTQRASPVSGYADGNGDEARFSAPQGVAFIYDSEDTIVVADTGNFLIRWVLRNGTTSTLAGDVVAGEYGTDGLPLPGCPPPCMRGQQGFRDGNLSYAQFYNPSSVARGFNGTVWVSDEQRIRLVELPGVLTTLYSIQSSGRVSTIAGNALQGHEDGDGAQATFFEPSGVYVTSDNIAHVVDVASCRIRRITPLPLVAQFLSCKASAFEVIRPSGCTSYDQATDKIGRKVSRVEANIQYNYGWPNAVDLDRGKYIKNCLGVPPPDRLDKHFIYQQGDNLVVDDHKVLINEDSEQGMAIVVACPAQCSSGFGAVYGTTWYSEYSSVCGAALHAGKLRPGQAGYAQIILQRRAFLFDLDPSFAIGSPGYGGIISHNISADTSRVFSIDAVNSSMYMVHTIGGHPSAPLESGCSFADAQPPTLAYFNKPSGIAAASGSVPSDSSFLYIADSFNNRIRGISAVCSQICENGGRCIRHDICACAAGWNGIDCTTPVCNTVTCGVNQVCVAPDTCGCKPGYSGSNCDKPQCMQRCMHGGVCSFPDTCSCVAGWFDSNCTTPVCAQTCGNGGNCTAPDTCACPSQWSGFDCRTPVCEQRCQNGGFCIAPNTCACPAQWSKFDCSVPVCTQGYFLPNPYESTHHLYSTQLSEFPTYKQCDLESWCNVTKEFECDQLQIKYKHLQVSWGQQYRAITGRKYPPMECMNIELPIDFKIPFELLNSDNTTTGYRRFSPISPYTSNVANAWKGFFYPAEGHTGPWVYVPDRQIANVLWVNMSQGVYVCANGGNCTAPDVCECAPGWMGFDCRTPVCNQGYYTPKQTHFVSGLGTASEIQDFSAFLSNNTYTLSWPYSNPNYTMEYEQYTNSSHVVRIFKHYGGHRYLAQSDWSSGVHKPSYQGGYRCSIRSVTKWENISYIHSHPNYYSRYMDKSVQNDGNIYTHWTKMNWLPVSQKSRILDRVFMNVTYVYTNEGYKRRGIWNKTRALWQHGTCIMQFRRHCSDPAKQYDVESGLYNVSVQDTDLSFRSRLHYDDWRVSGPGRWREAGGPCVDEVQRGCYNNGTCVAPDTCSCAEGWSGYDCSIPVCAQPCLHRGNCTGPNQCTCEKGWSSEDCSVPLCAQECQNGGKCVAPDVCKCQQWPNDYRNGRVDGGLPLFPDQNGNPVSTGWTGYDCSVPICVQATNFFLNVPLRVGYNLKACPGVQCKLQYPELNIPVGLVGPEQAIPGTAEENIVTGFHRLGGRGGDGNKACGAPDLSLPRCPTFDLFVTGNEGVSFQTGCGYDPFDTGCCISLGHGKVRCFYCDLTEKDVGANTYFCAGDLKFKDGDETQKANLDKFLDRSNNLRMCGAYHSPRSHAIIAPQDYGNASYFTNHVPQYSAPLYSSRNYLSNLTSNRYLCHVTNWTQGDYIDDAGLGSISAVGSIYGLSKGRHIRVNHPVYLTDVVSQKVTLLAKEPGEGVYGCANYGACVAPDACTCTDGYSGFDCKTPLCRHLQPFSEVTGCLNGGVCASKDSCACITVPSVLWQVHPAAKRGLTGWTGTDCSMPVCTQGHFDPFCTDLLQAPGGEGCYRCSNGGNCTAPDVCTCAPGWTGYDCTTPVCEVVADPLTRLQLGSVVEEKIIDFESDPCSVKALYRPFGFHGRKYIRGNCTQPYQCTCFCKVPYDFKSCKKTGHLCDGPWQDNMVAIRNLLAPKGVEYIFGSSDCVNGFEGNVDMYNRFTTCHLSIYVPSATEKSSLALVISMSIIGFLILIGYYFVRNRLRRRFLSAKIERRRVKRSWEESAQGGSGSALAKRPGTSSGSGSFYEGAYAHR